MSLTVVYRRLCGPAQRISLHFMYGGSIVGKKMFPGKMAMYAISHATMGMAPLIIASPRPWGMDML